MKRVLTMLAFVFVLAPSVAQAAAPQRVEHSGHATCRSQHGGRFCEAREHRHALRVIRQRQMQEVRRTHVKFHRSYYHGWDIRRLRAANHWERHRLRQLEALPTYEDPQDVRGAILHYFGRFFDQAWVVTACESTHSIYDQLGQYLGLFQMGDYARARYGGTYGKAANAWTQAKAAWGYFADSGYDWSPWSCKPDGSVRYPG